MTKKPTLVEWLIVILVFALAFSFLIDTAPAVVVANVLLGWVGFIGRIPRLMQWRWEALWSVLIYATLLIVGGHFFARWLYQHMRGERWRMAWSLRFFFLFMLMFAAGTSAVAIVHQTTWIITQPEPMFGMGLSRANRVKCSSNLRQIGECIEVHAKEHGGKYPDDLQQLIIDADLNPEVLVCPSSDQERARGATTQESAANAHKDLHYSYLYLGKGLVQPVEPLLVIAYERQPSHEGHGMNVLFADGHCEWFPKESMQKLLAQIQAAGGKAILFDSK
jgi:prepilin-type processing-associated H-X9-DG protein